MLVYISVPEITHECQDEGQVRSTLATIQKNRMRKRVTHLIWTILDVCFNDEPHIFGSRSDHVKSSKVKF